MIRLSKRARERKIVLGKAWEEVGGLESGGIKGIKRKDGLSTGS